MSKIFEVQLPFGPMMADIRSGCCGVYERDKKDDSNGLHQDQERIIFYSNKGMYYNGNHWDMDKGLQDLARAIAAIPEMLKVVRASVKLKEMLFENPGNCTPQEQTVYSALWKAIDELIETHGTEIEG